MPKGTFEMGGPGSGSLPENGHYRGGRQKKAAVSVIGSGVPTCPEDLPPEVRECWWAIADQVQGVAFAQDSHAITEAAYLLWRQRKFHEHLMNFPLDVEANRLSLAVGRGLANAFSQFGLTPRSRQILLVPKEEEEKDEFEKLMNNE